jgi:hypothetical protein
LLTAAPATQAPAGFVADVLAALDAPPRLSPGTAAGSMDGPADARVDAEWERIELERIAGEIAEAREDAAVAETTAEPRRWPWMTMLAALAAGMLVTTLVNMPPLHSVLTGEHRDVALQAGRAGGRRSSERGRGRHAGGPGAGGGEFAGRWPGETGSRGEAGTRLHDRAGGRGPRRRSRRSRSVGW